MTEKEPINKEFINVNGIIYVPYEMFKHEHDFAQVTLNRLNELEHKPKDMLDKIRDEIIERAKCTMNDTRAEGLYIALDIVNKYKAEKE